MLREKILQAAVDTALKRGLSCIRRLEVARIATAAPATINYHFGSMEGLRNAVIQHAIEKEILPLIAQGLVQKHPLVVTKLPEALQRKAARSLYE